ncbi:MAG: glycosyltransferase [Gammaproteobacteria bacterium]
MRIAQVMLAKRFGGAERSFVDITNVLTAAGHEVVAIGDARGVALDALEPRPTLERVALHCHGTWDRLAEYSIRRALARFAPSVVHAHLARAAHLGGRAAHALRIPTLAKTHNLVNLKYYQHIDRLVPTTRLQEDYLRTRGIAPAALTRIPNFSRMPAVPAPPPLPAPPWRLVTLGRFVAKKGFDVLLTAFAELRAAGLDVSLDIGGDGPERARLERQVARLGLTDVVHLPGWIDDTQAFLDGAALFVLPSRDEPFGIVLLEAMARGLPIVATASDGPREILTDGAAALVAIDDPGALAAAMRASLAGAGPAHAASALARYREHFRADVVVARYLALYAELAQAGTRSPRN